MRSTPAPVKLELLRVALPLRSKVKHASHERETSENLVARLTLENGVVGHGESVPRSYVTGETPESALRDAKSVDLARLVGTPPDLRALLDAIRAWDHPRNLDDPRGMAANSARCALEIAVLDAYARVFGLPLSEVVRAAAPPRLPVAPAPAPVRYSGAILAKSPRKETLTAWKLRLYGFRDVKIKVGVQGQDDPARLAKFRAILGPRRDLRLDANEAWTVEELPGRVASLLPARPSLLEQPVPHARLEALAELRNRPHPDHLPIPVMLDESLCGLPDADRAIRIRAADFFNVRLSKCGGILKSLELAARARDAGLGLQLGCHPGESGILSAAGRAFACVVPGIRYLEGSYDRHILAENLLDDRHDVTFGYGGRAKPLAGPGLGVEIDPAKLERLALSREEIDLQ